MTISPISLKYRPIIEDDNTTLSESPKPLQAYKIGTQLMDPSGDTFEPSKALDPKVSAILRIINNFNSEPLFVGNGLILFNKPSRLFSRGVSLAPLQAITALNDGGTVLSHLARVRPALSDDGRAQVCIVPITNFSYQIDSEASLVSWWKTVGRNFCDGVF